MHDAALRDTQDASWPRSPSSTALWPTAWWRSPHDRSRQRTGASGSPTFAHLLAMSDVHGLFEHAVLDGPPGSRLLRRRCRSRLWSFCCVVRAQRNSMGSSARTPIHRGGCRRRRPGAQPRGCGGAWTDDAGLGDWWGRAVCALGAGSVDSRQLGSLARANRVRSRRVVEIIARARDGVRDAGSGRRAQRRPRRPLRSCLAAGRGRLDRGPVRRPLAVARAAPALRQRGAPRSPPRRGCGHGRHWVVARGLAMLRFLLDVETVTATCP